MDSGNEDARKLSGRNVRVFRDINESEILELDSVLIVRVFFRALTNTCKHYIYLKYCSNI